MSGVSIKDYIKNTLLSIKTFINQAKEDTDYKGKNLDDVKEVITIMASIANIQKNHKTDVLKLDIIDEMIRPLKKMYGESKELSDWNKEAKHLLNEWNVLVMISNTVDKHIKPIVDTHMEKTKDQIKKLEDRMKEYHTSLKTKPFYLYDTGYENAKGSLDEVSIKTTGF